MPLIRTGAGEIEYFRITGRTPNSPAFVMLHEGLGSVSMWRDFPAQLAQATGAHVIAYSRHGYGKSTPLVGARDVGYMHDEALIVLPQLLDALGVNDPILFG